jgi:murein L,D-transpeptidase YcbB/YkuD
MLRRGISLVLCGAVALGLVGCGASSKSGTGSSTIPTIGTTLHVAASSTANVTVAGATSTVPAASTSTVHTATTTKSTTGATTTIAGRVVTKPNDNVHLGDTGPGVKQIQNALAAQGYKVSVDGKFGAQTAQAVKSFQTKNGLKQDGIVGPATWAKLQATPTVTTTKPATTTTLKRTTTT